MSILTDGEWMEVLLFRRVLQAVVEQEDGDKFKEYINTMDKETADDTGRCYRTFVTGERAKVVEGVMAFFRTENILPSFLKRRVGDARDDGKENQQKKCGEMESRVMTDHMGIFQKDELEQEVFLTSCEQGILPC